MNTKHRSENMSYRISFFSFSVYIFLLIVTVRAAAQDTTVFPKEKKKIERESKGNSNRIGVSLSGGGALGFCHIGALEALDSAETKIDVITGVSMGSLIAALYANGYNGEEIFNILKKERIDRMLHIYRPNFHFSGGMIDTRRLQRMLTKYLPHNSFDSLKTKFYCCVTDITNCTVRYVCSGGNLVQFVIASLAVPALFAPIKIDSVYYFDGGSFDMMPFKPLEDEYCNIRIGIYPILLKKHTIKSPRFLWIYAYNGMFYNAILRNKDHFSDLIAIDPQEYSSVSFKHIDKLRTLGFNEAKKQISITNTNKAISE